VDQAMGAAVCSAMATAIKLAVLANLTRMLMERRARAGLGRLPTASEAAVCSDASGFFLQVLVLSGKAF
jgi:hypothetical protein